MHHKIEQNFIWIILTFSGLALFEPSLFIWIKPYITLLLGIILFGIGFTIQVSDFKIVWKSRWTALLAIVARYLLMPSIAYAIGEFLHLSSLELIGLVILGSCPGGTAANVMAYLSRANVALTVILTFGTTLLAPIAMPSIIYFFLHKEISIPFLSMFENILLVVFIPLTLGILVKKYFVNESKNLARVFPTISIFAISLAIACILSLSQEKVFSFPVRIMTAVIVLNVLGYLIGFIISKCLRCKIREQKSIFLEYGIFDSALGVIIATNFFGPLAALPSALISIIQNVTASFIVKKSMNNITASSDIEGVKQYD
ncbi:MAG: bile acid:sodium symporter family protein [Proteobacteria bacterium]|nr:bile acid:sodium symporter family protein [Pseudomonadota bacterium]